MAKRRRRISSTRKTAIGKRFDRCVKDVTARGGVRDPSGICAASMRKAYGEEFQEVGAAGRHRAAVKRHRRGKVRSRATGRLVSRPASRIRAIERSYANRNPRGGPIDHDAVRELTLYAENDGDLHRSMERPIMRNLARKMINGSYDPNLAVKGWMHWADAGARKYAKEFGGTWNVMFSPATRHAVAVQAARHFESEAEIQGPDAFLR